MLCTINEDFDVNVWLHIFKDNVTCYRLKRSEHLISDIDMWHQQKQAETAVICN